MKVSSTTYRCPACGCTINLAPLYGTDYYCKWCYDRAVKMRVNPITQEEIDHYNKHGVRY